MPCSDQLAPELTGALSLTTPELQDGDVQFPVAKNAVSSVKCIQSLIQGNPNLNALPPPISLVVVRTQFLRV
jgi:hypothetical protein